MLGELDFYLPKSFCSTNVYGEYTKQKKLIVSLPLTPVHWTPGTHVGDGECQVQ